MNDDLATGASTHPGNVRDLNEDCFLVQPPVFVVADGMGGHRAGEVASRIVVDSFAELADEDEVTIDEVERCIARCQARIVSLDDGHGRAPGSTLVGAIHLNVDGRRYWLVVNIGDSRAYMMVDGRLEQVTHDHTVVQELLDAGRITPFEAAHHPERHVITRALGVDGETESEYSLIPVFDGATLLLCSDGVSNEMDDHVIARHLARVSDPETIANEIVDDAVRRGGRDNATAVVVQVECVRSYDPTVSHQEISIDTVPKARQLQ